MFWVWMVKELCEAASFMSWALRLQEVFPSGIIHVVKLEYSIRNISSFFSFSFHAEG